jgi:prevent-host-death family protein
LEKIGIHEVKNSLSRYVKRVKKGEPFIITERGVPVAKLMPLETNIPGKISHLLEKKIASWNGEKPGSRAPLPIKGYSGKTLAEIVEEDRR